MATVSFRNVRKSFGNTEVVHGIDLDIRDGEFIVLLGPSGCAKSTTLRLLAGLESVTEGEILIDGRCVNDLTPKERGIAMVFQNYALYPHMTVYENIAFSQRIARVGKDAIRRKVHEVAEILQLTPLLERYPAALSGGQRQRVAIGRAMVRQPKVFLFDEPLSNLDTKLRHGMRAEIQQLHRALGATMVYVTHDQTEAMTLADRIVVMNHGRIVQVGTPREIYERPANRFVATFIGAPAMNIVPLQHESGRLWSDILGDRLPLPIPASLRAGRLALGIRPNHVSVCAPNEAHVRGTVKLVEYLGNELVLTVELQERDQLLVQLAPGAPIRPGQEVHLKFSPERCHLFDAESGDVLHVHEEHA